MAEALETALRGAISTVERPCVAILIAQDLNLQVPGLASEATRIMNP